MHTGKARKQVFAYKTVYDKYDIIYIPQTFAVDCGGKENSKNNPQFTAPKSIKIDLIGNCQQNTRDFVSLQTIHRNHYRLHFVHTTKTVQKENGLRPSWSCVAGVISA